MAQSAYPTGRGGERTLVPAIAGATGLGWTARPPSGAEGEAELKISARLLLHISRQPRFAPLELVPDSLTQSGMATALRSTQAGVAHALGRLVLAGLLEVRKAPVRGRSQRVKVYELTPRGEALVAHIRAGMGR
jgi:hypothetical protein